MSKADIEKFAKDNGFTGWFETSAKANQGIDNAMVIIWHVSF
jgi:hypothetical protein